MNSCGARGQLVKIYDGGTVGEKCSGEGGDSWRDLGLRIRLYLVLYYLITAF